MRDYAKFHEQDDFTGGMNDTLRSDKILKNQCALLQGTRISADGVTLDYGYDYINKVADVTSGGVSFAIPDNTGQPTALFMMGRLGVMMINTGGSITTLDGSSWPINSLVTNVGAPWSEDYHWCGLALGGSSGTPDAVIISTGAPNLIPTDNANASILRIVSNTVTRWNVATSSPAFSSMAYHEGRVFGINKQDQNLYYSPVRSSWTTDANDWEFLTVGASESAGIPYKNSSVVVLKGELYLFKEVGIFRIEYTGTTDLYRYIPADTQFGCLSDRQLVVVRDGIIFSDARSKKLIHFNGDDCVELTGYFSVTDSITSTPFTSGSTVTSSAYDALAMVYDSYDNTVDIYYPSQDLESENHKTVKWTIYLDYGPDPSSRKYAFSKTVLNDPIEYVLKTRLPFYANSATKNGLFDVLFASNLAANTVVFKSNILAYTMNGVSHNAIVTFPTIDMRKTTQGSSNGETMRKHGRIRQVDLDMSADGPVAIDVQCRDKEGTFETVKTITLSDDEFQYHQVGADRPGFYPQFRIKSNAATRRWVLRGIEYFGDTQGMR